MSDPYLTDVRLSVNGRVYERRVEARMLLSDFLRHELGLTGTHVGCEHGVCGCCTVILNGVAARSCLTLAAQADGADVRTVEGLGEEGGLSLLQESFREHHALQCGFCTPGFLIAARAFLDELGGRRPSRDEVRAAMAGNLCRCTGYQNIIEAVLAASVSEVKEAE